MKKEICLRTEGYGGKNVKVFLDVTSEGELSTAAMLEDSDGDGVIDIVKYVGDIDGDGDRDDDDKQLLLDIGNLLLKIKLYNLD